MQLNSNIQHFAARKKQSAAYKQLTAAGTQLTTEGSQQLKKAASCSKTHGRHLAENAVAIQIHFQKASSIKETLHQYKMQQNNSKS